MAVTLDALSGPFNGSASTLTFAHTCAAGATLFVKTQHSNTTDVSGVTYNGVAMTQVGTISDGTGLHRATLWRLKNPATGANNVVITWGTTPASQGAGASSWLGVDQTTSEGTAVTNTGAAGTQPTVTVASQAGNIVVDSMADDDGTVLTNTGTLIYRTAPGSLVSYGSQYKSGIASTVMNWTGANQSWATVAIEIKAASGAAASTVDTTTPISLLDTVQPGPWLNASPLPEYIGDTTIGAGSTNTQLTPAVASLVLTGATPSTVVGTVVSPAVASLVLTGATPSTVLGTVVTPSVATMTLTGASPSTVVGTVVSPAVVAMVLTGATPSTVLGTVVSPTAGALTLTGATPSTVLGTVVSPTVATMTLAGATPSAILGTVLSPAVAALTLTGATPTANVGVNLQPAAAAMTLTGIAPTLTATANVTLTPAVGAMTLTGIALVTIVTSSTGIGAGGGPPSRVWARRGTSIERHAPTTLTLTPAPARMVLRGMRVALYRTRHITLEPAPAVMHLRGESPIRGIVNWEQERADERNLLGIIDPGA